jgi:hypothetical protein
MDRFLGQTFPYGATPMKLGIYLGPRNRSGAVAFGRYPIGRRAISAYVPRT